MIWVILYSNIISVMNKNMTMKIGVFVLGNVPGDFLRYGFTKVRRLVLENYVPGLANGAQVVLARWRGKR